MQRGGAPCAEDHILATRLGSACADLINKGEFGVMVAARGDGTEPVPLDQVAGKLKLVPPDHSWVQAARRVAHVLAIKVDRRSYLMGPGYNATVN